MPVGKIRASTAGTVEKLKRQLKESSGGDKWFARIAADTEVILRLMVEPPDFVSFEQHFMEDREPKAFPCNTGDCEGCDEGNQASRVWAVPAVEIENNRARAYQLTKGVVDSLTKIFERRGTVLDRDIAIIREGSGKEGTKYTVEPLDRKRRDMSIFEAPDIMGMLETMLEEAVGASPIDDDDDEDDAPPRRNSRPVKKTASKGVVKKTRPRATTLDDDEDDWSTPPSTGRARVAKKASKAAVKPAPKKLAKKGLRRG